jgi:putative transposase
MPQYRRLLVPGGTYFFTVVTYERKPILIKESSVNLLINCIDSVNDQIPFKIDAMVILPDHLHTIWTLPDDDADYSKRWQQIKIAFSKQYQPDVT